MPASAYAAALASIVALEAASGFQPSETIEGYRLDPGGEVMSRESAIESLVALEKPVQIQGLREGRELRLRHSSVKEPGVLAFLKRQAWQTPDYLRERFAGGMTDDEFIILVRGSGRNAVLTLREYASWLNDYSLLEMQRGISPIEKYEDNSDGKSVGARLIMTVSGSEGIIVRYWPIE
jgi:hypothetical protein